MANLRDFENNVRKAQRLAKTSVPDQIETDITANTNKFQRAITKAKAMAQKWREHTVKLGMNSKEYQQKLQLAKAEVAKFKQHKVDLKLSDKELMAKYNATKATVEAWRKHVVKLDLDADPAKMAMRGFKKDLIDLNKHSFSGGRWRLGNLFAKEFKQIDGQATSTFGNIGNKLRSMWSKGSAAMDQYQSKMDRLATSIRTFGTVFGQQIKGLMIASFQALIPIIAGLVPAIMAVLNAISVLGGGILGLAGAIGIAAGGFVAFGAMAISAIKMLNDGTLQATKETRAYQNALDGVKSTWQSIIKQNQAQIFNTLANGLNTVKTALTALKPFIAGVSNSMEQASQKVLKWAQNSQTASKFFKMMNTTGVKTFDALLSAAGRFGDGLVNVFTQLAPLFLWVAQGLDNLGKKFQNWANSVAGQNAIKAFIEYTKANLPKIGQIFGNVFAGIGNLMIAFGKNSSGIFDWLVKLTSQFRQWSETVGKSEGFKQFISYVQKNGPVIMQLIGNIVRALVAFGTAMAPIASVLLQVVTAIAGFIAKLFEAHPAVAKFFGILMILSGVIWALLAPIIAVGTVLSNVFGVSILQAIGAIFNFVRSGTVMTTIINILRTVFGFLMSPIANIAKLLPLLGSAFTALTGPIGIIIGVIVALVAVIVYLWNTNENFRNMIITAWNSIVATISAAVGSIVNWFMQLWASIQQTLQPIMPILQMLGQVFMQVLGVIVTQIIQTLITNFQLLWTIISVVFTAIGGIISVVVQIIVGLFTVLIQLLSGDFSGAWLTIQNVISSVMSTIWSTLVSIWNQISAFIFGILNRILGTNITSWGQIWQAIVGFVTNIWNSVSSWFGRVASTVLQKMGQALAYIISQGVQWVSSIINAMVQFVQGIISGFLNVVSEVGSGMSNAYNAIVDWVSGFVDAGMDLMRGLVQGIMNGISWVVDAARNVASSAVNAAKSVLGIHSPSRVFRGIGQYVTQGLGNGILADQNKAVNAVRSVSKNITDAFRPDLSTKLTSDLTDGLNSSLNGSVDAHMSKDVQHSLKENNKPIVNVTVRNESDIPAIKSYIEDTNSKDAVFTQM